MLRSSDSAAFSLIELLVALSMAVIVVGGTNWYFVNFKKSGDFIERRASARIDALRAGALVRSLMARRNTSLDVDGSLATKSFVLGRGRTAEYHVIARQKSDGDANTEYVFHNICAPRPVAALPAPADPLGRCPFVCPPTEASSVVLTMLGGGSKTDRVLVQASDKGQAGAVADAVLCVVNSTKDAQLPEASFEIVVRFYTLDGRNYGGVETIADALTPSVRDPNVEMVGHE